MPGTCRIERLQFGQALPDGAVGRVQFLRLAQGVQCIGKPSGHGLALGQINLHLHHMALRDGLPHQVFSVAGIPIRGIGIRVVSGLPVALVFKLQALLIGLFALFYVGLARRRWQFFFQRRIARCGR